MTKPLPGILDPAELDAVRTEFGVADLESPALRDTPR